ncbi:MAG: tyrosine recombinase XerC [Ruminococcus sp.]|nr:tyrosine recombinase XerC [Ruminococcus sp.]
MKKEYRDDCPEYLLGFLTHLRVIENRAPRTEEAYYTDLRCFLRYLLIDHNDVDPNKTAWESISIKNVPFDYLKSFTLYDAYNYLRWLADDRNNSPKTRARKTSALKHFYNYLANKSHQLESNPLETLESPHTTSSLPKYLTLGEAQQLLATIETKNTERDYCIITLFLNCGMRLSELCGIDMGDISFENRTLRLFGKGRKERIVSLNNACITALNDYLPHRKTEGTTCDALFFSNKKNRISKRRVQEIVEECIKKAGLSNMGITTHKLRHTAATLMYQNGVDTLVLKDVLGHKSIATTEIYTHLNDENIKEAIDANPLADNVRKK